MRKLIVAIAVTVLFIGSGYADVDPLEVCGNVNQSLDGKITLSDITGLIDHVYISKQPLANPWVANINGSLDELITLSDIVALIGHVYLGESTPNCLHVESVQLGCRNPDMHAKTSTADGGFLFLEVLDKRLIIRHYTVYMNCGHLVQWDIQIDDNLISAFETGTDGPFTFCYCDMDVEAVVGLLPDGEYEVLLIGLDGFPVGIDTAGVGLGPGMISYSLGGYNDWPDPHPDSTYDEVIEYTYDQGQLSLNHFNADIPYEVVLAVGVDQAGDTLRITEHNLNSDLMWYDYMFRRNVEAVISDVDPGTYVVEVYHQVHGFPPDLLDQRTVTFGE